MALSISNISSRKRLFVAKAFRVNFIEKLALLYSLAYICNNYYNNYVELRLTDHKDKE